MATRFYLPISLKPPDYVLPEIAYDGAWEKTTSIQDRGQLVTASLSTSLANVNNSENVATNPYDVLVKQFISEPLAAQTISGTVKGQMQCYESNADADFGIALVINVVAEDNATVRGTLLSYFPASIGSEFYTSRRNIYAPPSGTALSSVECLDGDRIVIEYGFRSYNSHTTARSGYLRFGDGGAGGDLPENETETGSTVNPWIEFSGNLTFLPGGMVSRLCVEYLYTEASPRVAVSQLVVEYLYVPAEEAGSTFYRTFPLPPAQRLLQSQDCRKFPRFKE